MLKKINFISRAKRRYVLALCLVCALAGSLLLFRLTAIDRDLAATRDATNGSWNYAFVSRVGPDPQFMNSLEEQAREYAVLETLEVMARIRPGATDSAADGGAADSGTDSGGADSGGKGSEGTPIQLIRLVKYDAAAFAMMSLTPTEGAWTDTAGNMAIEARMANTAREGESLPDMEMTCELAELPQEAAVAVLAGQSAGELAFADRLSLNLQTEAAFKDFAAQLFPADLAASAQNAEFTQVVHWIVAAADFTRVLQAVDTSRSYHQHIVLAKINRTNAFPALAESWLADRGRLVASDDLSAQEKWQAGRRAILLNRYQLSDEELHGGQTELIRPNAQPENAVAARRIFQLSAQRASFGLLFLLIILVGALLYYSLQIGNISLPVLRNFKLSGLTNSNLRRLILGKEVGLSLLSIFVGWLLGSGIALVLPLISPETVNLLAFPTIGIQLLVLFLLAASQTLPYFLYALTKLARPPFAMTEQHAAFLGSQAPQRPRQPRKRILSADAGASRSKSERALGKLPTGYAGLLSRRAFSFNRRSKGGYYFVLLFLIIFAALLSFMQTVHAATYSEQFRSTDLSIGIQNSISRYSELSIPMQNRSLVPPEAVEKLFFDRRNEIESISAQSVYQTLCLPDSDFAREYPLSPQLKEILQVGADRTDKKGWNEDLCKSLQIPYTDNLSIYSLSGSPMWNLAQWRPQVQYGNLDEALLSDGQHVVLLTNRLDLPNLCGQQIPLSTWHFSQFPAPGESADLRYLVRTDLPMRICAQVYIPPRNPKYHSELSVSFACTLDGLKKVGLPAELSSVEMQFRDVAPNDYCHAQLDSLKYSYPHITYMRLYETTLNVRDELRTLRLVRNLVTVILALISVTAVWLYQSSWYRNNRGRVGMQRAVGITLRKQARILALENVWSVGFATITGLIIFLFLVLLLVPKNPLFMTEIGGTYVTDYGLVFHYIPYLTIFLIILFCYLTSFALQYLYCALEYLRPIAEQVRSE